MVIGIIPNIAKDRIIEVVEDVLKKIISHGFDYLISESLLKLKTQLSDKFQKSSFLPHNILCERSDLLVSIGGDGTMLNTAFEARRYGTPMAGLNFGKLGFLAEFDVKSVDTFLKDIKNNHYSIEERMALQSICSSKPDEEFYAINDLVISRGKWPKMIELTLEVDGDYVSTFSADGLIIATPTGSTGYSLSTGGPIVSPNTDAITISPISPHTLTMRPLVLSSKQRITVSVESLPASIQLNCDGQRVYELTSPFNLDVYKCKKPMKLLHTHSTNYYEILRDKLYWGLDIRNNKKSTKELP